VVLSRGANPASGEAEVTPESVPDIGRSLQHARTQAGLTLPEAAMRIGVASSELESLESGTVGRMTDRIETLRALRTYADSLGLPGADYVLTVLDLWPSIDIPSRNGDTGVVPVVSVSTAPAGGHSPAGDYGTAFPADSTGVSDSTVTGVVGSIPPPSINDTRPVPIFETGQVPAVRTSAPRYLKVLVGLVSLLVVLAGIGLGLHNQLSSWIHSAQSDIHNQINKATNELEGKSTKSSAKKTASTPTAAVKVTLLPAPGGQAATFTADVPSFTVAVVTDQNPSWTQVTNSGTQAPVFSQVIPGGQTKYFPVTGTTTIETGSSAAHFLMYEGYKPIGYYVPTRAPFTMTFSTAP
jgi:hypothetical protein